MKVTFIYPSLSGCGFSASSDGLLLRPIHQGLCYLSSCIKKAGHETELIELKLLKGWDDFEDRVKRSDIQIAAITIMSPDYPDVVRCVDIIKRINPKTKIVVGGIHPTVMTKEVEANDKIDYIVRGEGESSFVELLDKLASGEAGGRVIEGRGAIVDELPFVDRYLFDCLESPWDFFMPLPYFTIMAGRGCSYNCKFCAPASKMVHGKGSRRRSVKSVIDELKILRDEFGMKSFMFSDDCFTENKTWVFEFCEAYEDLGFDHPFICQTRADIICKNPEMFKKLSGIGLRMALIGFESGNDRILKFIGKGVTAKQNLEAAKICRACGIRIFASYILGLPTETNEEARDTVNMIKKIRPYRAGANFFTPLPGSYLYDYCKEHDLSLIDDHDCLRRVASEDRPKIRGIDHEFIINAVKESQEMPWEVRLLMKTDRIFPNRRNRKFLRSFREMVKGNPGKHKLDILKLMLP